MNRQVVVIGLDGFDMDHYDKLRDKDLIPNIEKIVEGGVSGELRSTVPPQTPPAWISFITGKNPGKHGIFGFSKVEEGTGKRDIYSYNDVRTEDIFDYVQSADPEATIGAVNIPLTYPPKEINGFMVSGFPTEANRMFAYPNELEQDLKDRNYKLRVQDTDDREEFVEIVRQRGETFRWLLEEKTPDFFFGVFKENENAHHSYWGEPVLEEIYAAIDEEIGKMLEIVDDNALIVLGSDHGFGEKKRKVALGEWLVQEGYTEIKSGVEGGTAGVLSKILEKFNIRKSDIRTFFKKTGLLWIGEKVPQSIKEAPPGAPKIASIGWQKSSAYSIGYGRVYCLDDDKKGEIKKKLEKLVDPETGEKVFDHIHERNEVYHGPVAQEGPDLIPEWPWDYSVKSWTGGEVFGDQGCDHQQNGMFTVYSAGIEPEDVEERNIEDVAPTILHLGGLPVPEDMDGEVIVNEGEEPERKEYRGETSGLDI